MYQTNLHRRTLCRWSLTETARRVALATLTLLLTTIFLLVPRTAMAGQPSPIADSFIWPVGKPNGDGWGLYGGYSFLKWAYVGKDGQGNALYEWHPGVDLNWGYNNDVGQPVYAVANGVVAEAHPDYKWYVLLEHTLPNGKKVWSNYKHIVRDPKLSVGAVVKKGQQIGTIDGAAHLHFEIRTRPPSPSERYAGCLWVVGQSKEWVKARFKDPIKFIEGHRGSVPPKSEPGRLIRSRLYINKAGDLTLEFCGVNLHQKVEVRSWRVGRDFGTRKVRIDFGPSEQCVKVRDLDGAGPVNPRTLYYSGVSTVSGQAGKICHNVRGLCDQVYSP